MIDQTQKKQLLHKLLKDKSSLKKSILLQEILNGRLVSTQDKAEIQRKSLKFAIGDFSGFDAKGLK